MLARGPAIVERLQLHHLRAAWFSDRNSGSINSFTWNTGYRLRAAVVSVIRQAPAVRLLSAVLVTIVRLIVGRAQNDERRLSDIAPVRTALLDETDTSRTLGIGCTVRVNDKNRVCVWHFGEH